MLMTFEEAKIEYACPICKCYYRDTQILSYNTFNSIYYTDGFREGPMMIKECYVLKCPQCGGFFLAKDLKNVELDESEKKNIDTRNLIIGSIDNPVSIYKYDEWEEIIKKGVYINPVSTEEEKKAIEKGLYIHLWRAYNRNPKITKKRKDRYIEICNKLLEICLDKTTDEMILRAEIYRNIGDFDNSLKTLASVEDKDGLESVISTIENACKEKTTQTVIINYY